MEEEKERGGGKREGGREREICLVRVRSKTFLAFVDAADEVEGDAKYRYTQPEIPYRSSVNI